MHWTSRWCLRIVTGPQGGVLWYYILHTTLYGTCIWRSFMVQVSLPSLHSHPLSHAFSPVADGRRRESESETSACFCFVCSVRSVLNLYSRGEVAGDRPSPHLHHLSIYLSIYLVHVCLHLSTHTHSVHASLCRCCAVRRCVYLYICISVCGSRLLSSC